MQRLTVKQGVFDIVGGELVQEASTLGLKPGEFPEEVDIAGNIYAEPMANPDGSLVRYISRGASPRYLVIFND